MNIRDVLFNEAMPLEKVTKKGMCGGTFNPTQRIGDLQNTISVSSASAFISKDYLKSSHPYSVSNTSYSELDPYLNTSFGDKLLQHLMHDYHFTADFTPAEERFYHEYREYQLGVTKTDDLLTALVTLDEWLNTEVFNGVHSEIRPTYNTTFIDIYINLHFLLEFRRQLSGDIAEGTSTYSKAEEVFHQDYAEFTEGITKRGDTLLAVEELDSWLIDELIGVPHGMLNRDYSNSHKWRKTRTRD